MITASIDIGSNTVLLLIAKTDGTTGTIIPLRDEQRIPRISEGLIPSGIINEKAEDRLMSVLTEYFNMIKAYRCEKIIISATSAFRKAGNSISIRQKIENEFHTDVKILSGEEEAELAFAGTTGYGEQGSNRLVIDIGGGSTEIIFGEGNDIRFKKSIDTGVVALSEKYLAYDKPLKYKIDLMKREIKERVGVLPEFVKAPTMTIALAGTPVTLACIDKGLTRYQESKVEGLKLTREKIAYLQKFLSGFTPSELLNKFPEIVRSREDLILSGTTILLFIMELLNITEVIVSTQGIRYGAILNDIEIVQIFLFWI